MGYVSSNVLRYKKHRALCRIIWLEAKADRLDRMSRAAIKAMLVLGVAVTAVALGGCSQANFNIACKDADMTMCNLSVPESAVVHITNDKIEIKYNEESN